MVLKTFAQHYKATKASKGIAVLSELDANASFAANAAHKYPVGALIMACTAVSVVSIFSFVFIDSDSGLFVGLESTRHQGQRHNAEGLAIQPSRLWTYY